MTAWFCLVELEEESSFPKGLMYLLILRVLESHVWATILSLITDTPTDQHVLINVWVQDNIYLYVSQI